jgi:predicted dehydrogenase
MVTAVNKTMLRIRDGLNGEERTQTLPPRATPFDDVFAYFAAVVRGDVVPPVDDLSGLDNNVMVVRILDASRESARLGRAISL